MCTYARVYMYMHVCTCVLVYNLYIPSTCACYKQNKRDTAHMHLRSKVVV